MSEENKITDLPPQQNPYTDYEDYRPIKDKV